MSAVPKPDQHYTYADYKSWELKEGERYELIYGVAYPMIFSETNAMAGPSTKHQTVSRNLFRQFDNFLAGKPCQAFYAPCDVRLFYEDEDEEDESDDTVVQPDILVVCDKDKIARESIHGAPDLVVEILSPTNRAFEMERKRKLYHDAGVREYWVVNPENNEITVYLFNNGDIITNYHAETETVPVSILPGLDINLPQVFAE